MVFQSAYASENFSDIETVQPVGSLPANTTVTWDEADTSKNYFTTNSGSYDSVNSDSLATVKSLSNTSLNAADNSTLQGLVSAGTLVVQKSDLLASSSSCTDGSSGCTLQSSVPVAKTSFFDLIGKFLSMLNPFNWFSSKSSEASNIKAVDAMTKTIEKGNSAASANGRSVTPACTAEEYKPANTGAGPDIRSCGVQQALAAYNKNRDKLDSQVIIYNDFSNGDSMGRMWFLNPDGTPANIIGKNPIWVAAGDGGFGAGRGSQKTPNGAIMTKRYNPPRSGNIKDGVELVGLESGNQDIQSRGVLLHGWDPAAPTEGCLGVQGTIVSDTSGHRVLGSPPPFLDELKNSLFKNGSVMIYNFTPEKKSQCN